MKVGVCNISEQDRDVAVEMHTALHEGLPPTELLCETWSNDRVSKKLGQATEIQYIKKIPDEVPSYHHPWAAQAQPTIGVTSNGQLRFFAGKYETTRRGIEDRVNPGMATVKYLKQPHVQREYLPSDPTGLITLGKLEWIKYNCNTPSGQVTKVLKFPKSIAPTVAHDQNGDLHLLGNQYLITEQGVEETMAHARKHSRSRRSHSAGMLFGGYDNPRRSSRARRRGHGRRRSNPSAVIIQRGSRSALQRAGDMLLSTAIIGSVGVATGAALDIATMKLMPTWSVLAKALTKIGAGVGIGMGVAALTSEKYAALPAGIAIGGAVSGLRDLYNLYLAQSVNTFFAPAPVVVLPPAAQVLMPGGVPQAYQAYSPQACGVAY